MHFKDEEMSSRGRKGLARASGEFLVEPGVDPGPPQYSPLVLLEMPKSVAGDCTDPSGDLEIILKLTERNWRMYFPIIVTS